MVEQSKGTAGRKNAEQWTTAGVRDCWLGGSNHTAVEHDLADRIPIGTPQLPYIVRIYRALLGRVVRYSIGVGVRQFLDLGSGLPTQGNVHEIAQAIDTECRVVYVDNSAQVAVRGQALLTGNQRAVMICADLRQPDHVLYAGTETGLLDLSTPLMVLLIDILHHIPDVDKPADFIGAYIDALPRGSYMAIAHTSDDEVDLATGFVMFRQLYHPLVPSLTFRDPMQITDLLKGLNIVEPGIVPIPLWRPGPGDDLGSVPERFPAWCGIGQKL
jgi:hypothetical protein